MMTQNFSYSRILAVWMVLFAFFCGVILPSVTLAKVEMAIATEGDPGDGLGASGGGGFNVDQDQNNGPSFESLENFRSMEDATSYWAYPLTGFRFHILVFPSFGKANIKFVICPSTIEMEAIR